MAFKSRNGSGGSRKKDYVSICRKTLDGIVKTLKKSVSDVVAKVTSCAPVKKDSKLLHEPSESQGRPFGKTYSTYNIQGKGTVVISEIEETFEDVGDAIIHQAPIEIEEPKEPIKAVAKLQPFPKSDMPDNTSSTQSCSELQVHTGMTETVKTTTASTGEVIVSVTGAEAEKVKPVKVEIDSPNKIVDSVVSPGLRTMKVASGTDKCSASGTSPCNLRQYDDVLLASMWPYNNEDISVEGYEDMQDDGYNPFDFKKKLFEPHSVTDRDIFAEEDGTEVDGMKIYAPIVVAPYNPVDDMISFGFFDIPNVPKVQETVKFVTEQKSEVIQDTIPAVMFSFGATASASGCTVSFTF